MCSLIKDGEIPEEGEISESPSRSSSDFSPWDSASSSYELLAKSPADDQSKPNEEIENYSRSGPSHSLNAQSTFSSVQTQDLPSSPVELLQQPATRTSSDVENQAPSFSEHSTATVEPIDSRRFSAEELGTLSETELVVRERGIEVEILRLRDLLLAIQQERQRRLLESLREEYPAGSRLTRSKDPIQFCANRMWARELALMVDARRQSEMLADQDAVKDRRKSITPSSENKVRSVGGSLGSMGLPQIGSPNNPLIKTQQKCETADTVPRDLLESEEKPPPPPPGRPRTLYTMDAINGLVYEVIEVDLTAGLALTPSGMQDLSDAHYVFGRDEDTDALVLLENITHLFNKFPYLNRKREI